MRIARSLFSSLVVAGLVVGVTACGGKGKGAGTAGTGTAAAGDRLPWEAALTVGATFIMKDTLDESGSPETVTVKVAAVETAGAARIYRLDWGDNSLGPTTLRVENGVVTVNDAAPTAMKEPFEPPSTDTTCYGEDLSNPDGCEDVCDADLCLSPDGIVGVSMLYAPGYSIYAAE
jgi:hypothetical protein